MIEIIFIMFIMQTIFNNQVITEYNEQKTEVFLNMQKIITSINKMNSQETRTQNNNFIYCFDNLILKSQKKNYKKRKKIKF